MHKFLCKEEKIIISLKSACNYTHVRLQITMEHFSTAPKNIDNR